MTRDDDAKKERSGPRFAHSAGRALRLDAKRAITCNRAQLCLLCCSLSLLAMAALLVMAAQHIIYPSHSALRSALSGCQTIRNGPQRSRPITGVQSAITLPIATRLPVDALPDCHCANNALLRIPHYLCNTSIVSRQRQGCSIFTTISCFQRRYPMAVY